MCSDDTHEDMIFCLLTVTENDAFGLYMIRCVLTFESNS